jgi:hypothetical protein
VTAGGNPPGPLERFAAVRWPGQWFVGGAAPSGRLAVLYALALGARSGHDYVGCEHLVAGAVRAGGLPHVEANDELRTVAVAAVASSQLLAEVTPEQVDAWFADEGAADADHALASVRLLPTLSPKADAALRRARGQAAASAAVDGATATHVLSAVLADPGIVGRQGVDLESTRRLAERRAGWGPLLDLLDEQS